MILGPDWIWLHFPKCGGTTAERLLHLNFGQDPDVVFDPIDPRHVIWHDTIARRAARDPAFSHHGKRIVANFRRLPDWIISRVLFEASRPPHHLVTRDQLVEGIFLENGGSARSAAESLALLNTPPDDHWVRIDHMHADFEAFFGRPLTAMDQRLNVNRFDAIRDRRFWFTRQEIEHLYHRAPDWAALEMLLYGNLLC